MEAATHEKGDLRSCTTVSGDLCAKNDSTMQEQGSSATCSDSAISENLLATGMFTVMARFG